MRLLFCIVAATFLSCRNEQNSTFMKPTFEDRELNFALDFLPSNQTNEEIHILRYGSIQFSCSYALVSILKIERNEISVKYSQIFSPFMIDRFPDKFYSEHPTAISHFFKLKLSKDNISRLKESLIYSSSQLENLEHEFFQKVKSEGIDANLFLVIGANNNKIGLINKYSKPSFQKAIYEIFKNISIREFVQMKSLYLGSELDINSILKKESFINQSRHFALTTHLRERESP